MTEGPDKTPREELYDRVLVSVGRVPRCRDLGFGEHESGAGRARLHQSQRQAGDRRSGDPGHRRHCGRRSAGAQGDQGGAHRGGYDHGRVEHVGGRDYSGLCPADYVRIASCSSMDGSTNFGIPIEP